MPTIKEIRSQYPQYDDMTDGVLAKKLYNAYYPDMSFDEYAQKINLFEKPKEEGLWEGFVKPTLKAIPKVAGTAAMGLASMPVSGLTGLGVGALAAARGRDPWSEASQAMGGVSQRGNFVTTPAEEQGMENIGLAMKPFQMAGEGWGQIGRATGIPYAEPVLGTMGEASAMFGLPGAIGKTRAKIKSIAELRELLKQRQTITEPLPTEIPELPLEPTYIRRAPIDEAAARMANAEGASYSPIPREVAEVQAAEQLGGVLSPIRRAELGLEKMPPVEYTKAGEPVEMLKPEPPVEPPPVAPIVPEPPPVAPVAPTPEIVPPKTAPVKIPIDNGVYWLKSKQLPVIKTVDELIGAFKRGEIKPKNDTAYHDYTKTSLLEAIAAVDEKWPQVIKSVKQTKEKIIATGEKETPEGLKTFKHTFRINSEPATLVGEGIDFAGYTEGKGTGGINIGDMMRKKLKTLARLDPAFAENPIFTVNAEGDLTAGFGKRSYRFYSDNISPRIKEFFGEGKIKEGDQIGLSPGYLENKASEIFLTKSDVGGPTLYGGIPGAAQMADVGKWIANTGPARKLAAFFQPELGVPQGKEWMYSRQAAKGQTALGEKFADSFVKKYKGIKPEDRQLIWEQMNSGADVSTLPKDLQGPAHEFRILDNSLGKMLVDNGLMSEETFKANMGTHIRYIYNIHQGGGDLAGGMGQKINTKFLTERKDLTDLQRQRLGLVKDPIQAIANSMADTYRAVGMSQHFQTIADNPKWVFEPAAVTIEGKKMGIGKVQKMLDAYDGVERSGQTLNAEQVAYRDTLKTALNDAQAVNVPKDYIQLNGSQYGALDGHYVRKQIAQDIKPMLDVFKSSSEGLNKVVSGIVAANGLWKMKNVALNIPTAARNTISNPSQLLMSGMRPDHVVTRTGQAIMEIYRDGKYHDEALRQGLFKTNFTTGELEDIISIARGFDKNNWVDFLSKAQKLGKYYGRIDDVFKLAKFIDVREAGKSASEAAYQANKWVMDYSLAHPAIKYLRNLPVGAPFVSYQYKVAPLIAESLAKRPWVIGGLMALPSMLQKAVTAEMTDEDAKRFIESLPEYVKNKQVFLIPGIHGMNALDVTYMVPWGNWYQIADSAREGKVNKAFKQMGVFSGLLPSVMYGVTTGKDLFTGKDIVSDLEKYDAKMTAWALTKWMWQQAAPPMLTETSVVGKVAEHLQYGQTSRGLKTEGMNVWPRIGGVNIYPVDPTGKVKGDRYEINNVRKALRRKMFDRNIDPKERKAAYDAYRMAVSQIRKPPEDTPVDEMDIQ